LPSLLRAFRHPAYRLFYAGQFVSILGNWLHSLATAWLVYRLTGSALLLGLTSAAQQLPMLFLAPVAGSGPTGSSGASCSRPCSPSRQSSR
jgi:hypothetical protein